MTLKRWLYIFGGATGLFLVYFFQDYLDFHSMIFQWEKPSRLDYPLTGTGVDAFPLIVNKTFRYILNDLFSIAMIYGIFGEKKYARFAVYVMFFGLLVLLPAYLFIYLRQPAGISSMLTHLHRVVMNPVLMMLLIPAFFYQKRINQMES